MWNRIKNFLLGALVLVSAWLGFNAVAVDNNISGIAPSLNTDGTPITDLASIRLYKAVGANCATATYSVLATIPFTAPGQTFTYLEANILVNGRHCYKATALRANGNESAFSNIAQKDVDLLKTNAPTGLTVS